MDNLTAFADKLLSFLPFNGNKTLVGMTVKALLPAAVAACPPLLVAAPFLNAAADFLITTGLAHKVAKKLAPKKED
jgi:hypothetical protein